MDLRIVPGLALSLLVLFTAGCGEEDMAGPSAGAVPDFSLVDVNPTSPRYGTRVSPRDYRGSISAWYFGHAT